MCTWLGGFWWVLVGFGFAAVGELWVSGSWCDGSGVCDWCL